jgi:shikimate dehydrogenase
VLKRLAVIGHPVAHSRSPAMQNAALAALDLDDGWSYEAIDVGPDEFERLVASMPGEGFVGANVTVPHKRLALELAGHPSDTAREIGAANTLSFDDGDIRADNTDAPGLLAALPESPAGHRALVLGAGGSARAAAWALVGEGAQVEIWNRTPETAEEVASAFDLTSVRNPTASAYELIVNCTSVGLADEDPFEVLPLERDGFRPGQTVVDLVYGDAETALVAAARDAGTIVVDGLEVLVRQGAESLLLWTGEAPPIGVMRTAAREG